MNNNVYMFTVIMFFSIEMCLSIILTTPRVNIVFITRNAIRVNFLLSLTFEITVIYLQGMFVKFVVANAQIPNIQRVRCRDMF